MSHLHWLSSSGMRSILPCLASILTLRITADMNDFQESTASGVRVVDIVERDPFVRFSVVESMAAPDVVAVISWPSLDNLDAVVLVQFLDCLYLIWF